MSEAQPSHVCCQHAVTFISGDPPQVLLLLLSDHTVIEAKGPRRQADSHVVHIR